MLSRKEIKIIGGIVGALSIVILIGLVYAGFTGQLNISGSAVGRDSTWDIHFENVSTITASGTAKVLSNHQPTINPNNRTQIQDYEVSLTSPNDSISFTFDVVNDGNYNASISDIDVGTPTCTSTDSVSAVNMCNNLTYSLTYANGATVQTNDVLYAKDKLSFKVTLQFNDISNSALLPTAGVSIGNLGIEIDFEQQGNALVNDDGTVANNRVYHQGDKITLNNEDYWVIENSGAGQDYVVALKGTSIGDSVYGETSDYDTSVVKGVVNSWSANNYTNDELKDVNGYKSRLITIEELNNIKSYNWHKGFMYCTMSPAFGTSTNRVYYIQSGGYIGNDFNVAGSSAVRPVINVYKSALETNNNE